MIINTHIHASITAADFAPAVWPLKISEAFSLAFEKNRSVIVFLTHAQMITLRDVLTAAIEPDMEAEPDEPTEPDTLANLGLCEADFR